MQQLYGMEVKILLMSPKRLLRPEVDFGRKVFPQLGHLTGAEKTVALSSMSGAVNECPQCGQVVLMNPLNIGF